MAGYLEEYFPLVVFFGLSLLFGLILMLAPLVAAVSNPDYEKNSAYECGFEPFESARLKFDIRFYLVAILFGLVWRLLFVSWAVGFQHRIIRFLVNDTLPVDFNDRVLYEWKGGSGGNNYLKKWCRWRQIKIRKYHCWTNNRVYPDNRKRRNKLV